MIKEPKAQTPETATPPDAKSRIWGFDAIRFIAMGSVAIRHLFHISDLDAGILNTHPGLAVFSRNFDIYRNLVSRQGKK